MNVGKGRKAYKQQSHSVKRLLAAALTALLTASICLLPVTAADAEADTAAGKNIVRNGDFEKKSIANVHSFPEEHSVKVERKVLRAAHSGTGYLTAISNNANSQIAVDVPFEFGKAYEISFWMRVEEGAGNSRMLIYRPDSYPNVEFLSWTLAGTGDWKKFSAKYKCALEGEYGADASAKLLIYLHTANVNYMFDDISVVEIPGDSRLDFLLPFASFADMDGHWAKNDVDKMAFSGAISGVSQGQFAPEQDISVAEFTAIVTRALKDGTKPYEGIFADVRQGDWYADVLQTAYSAGFLDANLIKDKHISPDKAITREEMVSIIVNGYQAVSGQTPQEAELSGYEDAADIAGWAKGYFAKSLALGVMSGVSDTQLAPGATATRAQAAVLVRRLQDAIQHASLKDVVIEWAEKLETTYREKNKSIEADNLKADIEAFRESGQVMHSGYSKGILYPVRNYYQNPYVKQIIGYYNSARSLTGEEPLYVNSTDVRSWVSRVIDPHSKALDMKGYLWLFATPESPYYGDATLLKKILTNLESLSYAAENGSIQQFYTSKDSNYDLFFYDLFDNVYLTLREAYPGLIMPSLAARYEKYIDEGIQYQKTARQQNGQYSLYQNVDNLHINMLMAAGEALGKKEYIKEADALIKSSYKRMYDNGATPYMFNEHEIPHYHAAVIRDFAKTYYLTGNKAAKQVLEHTKGYYPSIIEPSGVMNMSEGLIWKQSLGVSGAFLGADIAANFTGDVEDMKIARIQRMKDPTGVFSAVDAMITNAISYNPETDKVTDLDRSGDFIKPDANLNGFRIRSGNFSVLGDLRDRIVQKTLDSEMGPFKKGKSPGRYTQVSAMIADEGENRFYPLNSVMSKAYTAVRHSNTGPELAQLANSAGTTHDSYIVNDSFATLSTAYNIGTFAGTVWEWMETPGWQGKEAWFTNKNRLIGYVSMESLTGLEETFGVSGRIQFNTGNNQQYAPERYPKHLEQVDGGNYKYGKFNIRVLAENYGSIQMMENVPVINVNQHQNSGPKGSELVFMDKTAADAGGNVRYKLNKGEPKYYLVELYPDGTEPAADVKLTTLPSGVVRLDIDEGGAKYALLFNATDKAVTAEATGKTLYAPGKNMQKPVQGSPFDGTVEIAPYQHVVVEQ